jgi:hypothetical protein
LWLKLFIIFCQRLKDIKRFFLLFKIKKVLIRENS